MDNVLCMNEQEYQKLDREIKRSMKRTAAEVVRLGYFLRRMHDERLYLVHYSDFDSYVREELHIDYSKANRFMNINKKYSFNGNSMAIDEKYEEYSQSLLEEMLDMPEELEEKVTPDMSIRQVRDIKRQTKQQEQENTFDVDYKEIETRQERMIATSQEQVNTGSEGELQEEIIVGIEADEDADPDQEELSVDFNTDELLEELDNVIDAEFRELEEPEENETVATSQQIPEEDNSANEDQEPADELRRIRGILEKEKKLLNDYLEVGDIPEPTMYRQKTIVGALANMLCELEDMEEKEVDAAEMQQELPALKNNDQRKQWLSEYKTWGLWYRDENIDVNYYKFDFPDGSRLVVAEYPQRLCYWRDEPTDEHYFHLLEKNKMGYQTRYDEQYRQQTDSETYLVEFLKNIQKKGDTE